MGQSLKLRVPQEDGEIVLTRGGDPDDVRRYQVSDHLVSPRNSDEQHELLLHVDGARRATAKELGESKPSANTDSAAGADGKPKE